MYTPIRFNLQSSRYFSLSVPDLPPGTLVSPSKNLLYNSQGILESFGGFTSLGSSTGGTLVFPLANGYVLMGTNEDNSDTGTGNVVQYSNRSLFLVGTGTVKTNYPTGSLQTVGNLTSTGSIPQIAVLNGSTYSALQPVGLPDPTVACEIEQTTIIGSGFIGKCQGSFTVVYSVVRSATGAESNGSPVSNLISLTNAGTIRVTLPTMPGGGSDAWFLYPSIHGFGSVGPRFKYKTEYLEAEVNSGTDTTGVTTGTTTITTVNPVFTQYDVGKVITGTDIPASTIISTFVSSTHITISNAATGSHSGNTVSWSKQVDGVARSVEVDFYDTELEAIQPPTSNNQAQACLFLANLGNVMCQVGSVGGLGLWASSPNFPEAYPVENLSFTSEPIIGISVRPQEGFFWLPCQNSIWAGVFTGVTSGPAIVTRPIVSEVGVKCQTAFCGVGTDLYLFSSGNRFGVVRGGQWIDLTSDIYEEIKGWDAGKVAVGYDSTRHIVVAAYFDGTTTTMFAYHIERQGFSPPLKITDDTNNLLGTLGTQRPRGKVKSAFTQNGVLYFSFFDNSSGTASARHYDLWTFDSGSLGSKFNATISYSDLGNAQFNKTLFRSLTEWYVDSGSTYTVRFYKNLADTSNTGNAIYTYAVVPGATGNQLTAWKKLNLKYVKQLAVQITGQGNANRLEAINLLFEPNNSIV